MGIFTLIRNKKERPQSKKAEASLYCALQHNRANIGQFQPKVSVCIKGGLELQGYEVGVPLPPQEPLSVAGREELSSILRQLGALGLS